MIVWLVVGSLVALGILGRFLERNEPRRRKGFIVELQTGAIAQRCRNGEMSFERAAEEMALIRYGAFSQPHLDAIERRKRAEGS